MVETIRKIYVRELREKQPVHTVFKVTRKAKQTGRSGKPFVVLTLGDKTGEVDGRIFENVDALEPAFVENDFVLVQGHVITWQKKPQLVVEQLERLDPEPIDPAEFAVPPRPEKREKPEVEKRPVLEAGAQPPSSSAAGETTRGESGGAVRHIRELVERVGDSHVRALLLAILDDPDVARGLPHAPAARGVHHGQKGGLAEHLLSSMKLVHRLADHYPMADRDLLLAGALLHEIGKAKEVSSARDGFESTDEGRLVGHLVTTAQLIREKAAGLSGFPPLLEQHLTHLVVAHLGDTAWGSPKAPVTIEALLVHHAHEIDARVASWLEFMERDPNEVWTEVSPLHDRHLWKGPVPTQRNRGPLEGRPGRRAKRSRGGREGREVRPKEREVQRGGLAFKPLTELAASVGAADEAPAEVPESASLAPERAGSAPADDAPAVVPAAEPPAQEAPPETPPPSES